MVGVNGHRNAIFSNGSCKHSEVALSNVCVVEQPHTWKHRRRRCLLDVEQEEPTVVEVDGRYYELDSRCQGNGWDQAHGSTS